MVLESTRSPYHGSWRQRVIRVNVAVSNARTFEIFLFLISCSTCYLAIDLSLFLSFIFLWVFSASTHWCNSNVRTNWFQLRPDCECPALLKRTNFSRVGKFFLIISDYRKVGFTVLLTWWKAWLYKTFWTSAKSHHKRSLPFLKLGSF